MVAKLSLALRGDEIVHIDSASVSEAKVYCLGCNQALTLIKGSEAAIHYYAHYEHSNQTCLPLSMKIYAKKLLYAQQSVKMPALSTFIPETNHGIPCTFQREKVIKAAWVERFDHVELDSSHIGLPFDAVVDQRGHKCGINFNTLGSKVEGLQSQCKDASVSAFEINLNEHHMQTLSSTELEQYILYDAPRLWLHNSKFYNWCKAFHKSKVEETNKNDVAFKGFDNQNESHLKLNNTLIKRHGRISEVLLSQRTLLTLSIVNLCTECKLISTSGMHCSNCPSKSLTKVKSSSINKSQLEQFVRNRYTEVIT